MSEPPGGTAPPAPGASPRRLDARLLVPALLAWGVGAWALGWGTAERIVVGALGVVAGLLMTVRGGGAHVHHGPRLAAAVAATAVATGLVLTASGLHEGHRRAGTVTALAQGSATVTVRGTVATEPVLVRPRPGQGQERPWGRDSAMVIVRLTVTEVEGRGGTSRVSSPVLVVADESWLGLGWRARVTARGRLRPSDPGDDVVAVLTPRQLTVEAPPPAPLRGAEQVRSGLRAAVEPTWADGRGLVPGLVVGDTSLTPPELSDAMTETGMSHLSAVSGSNVAIVVGALLACCTAAGVPRRARPLVAAVGLVGFVLLARPEPSVIRASAMGAVGLLSLSTSRRSASLPALATAVLVLLCGDPWLARSYGFALSTLATLGLVLWARPWAAALRRWWPGCPPWLAEAVVIPLAAQATTGPVIVLLQSQVSLIGLFTNLLAAPLVAPATILGVLAALVAVLWPWGAGLLGWAAAVPGALIGQIARRGAAVPYGALPWPSGAPGAVLLIALTVVALGSGPWAWWHVRHPHRSVHRVQRLLRRHAPAWLPSSAVLPLFAAVPVVVGLTLAPVGLRWWRGPGGWPPPGWTVLMCDVGQGDATLLRTGAASAVLVDTGPQDGRVGRCLTRAGLQRLDAVLLTHPHADHVDGLAEVLDTVPTGVVITSPVRSPAHQADEVDRVAREHAVPVQVMTQGQTLSTGGLTAEAMWPPAAPPGPGAAPSRSEDAEGALANDGSIVLVAETGGVRILLTGDIELPGDAGVRRQLALRGTPPVHVLKVAHHGSATQDERLIEQVAPRVALIGVGAGNDFGHPRPSTLALLARHGIAVERTDLSGDLAVERRGDSVLVSPGGRR